MEHIILNRLSLFATQIKSLSDKALNLCSGGTWNNDDMNLAVLTASKLQAILKRFNDDLYQYFNISVDPNPDEISNLTTVQLAGEEMLAEVEARIQTTKDLNTSRQNLISNSDSFHQNRKLPELNLPLFEGDILEWHQFWDQFSSNIDQRNLCDVDKLLYLKASLRGQAQTVVDGLETTNSNYSIAVETLKERYGKRTQIIDAHYSTLYKLKGAKKSEECRKTLDEIERHLRVLQSLGEDTNQNHLRFLLMEKFPETIIYEMQLKIGNGSIEEMRKQLNIIISAKEEAKRICVQNENTESSYTTETLHIRDGKPGATVNAFKFNKMRNPPMYRPSISASNKTHSSQKRRYESTEGSNKQGMYKQRRLICIFCQENHFNDKCTKVTTMDERKLTLRGKCFNCFQSNHQVTDCKLKSACAHCGKTGHNRALCPNLFPNDAKATNLFHVNENVSTVLQTAVVNVIGRDNITKGCRILLDSGSQRSYVTQKIAEDLKLKIEEKNHLLVFTFGSKKPQRLDSSLVKLDIRTRTEKTKTLYANVVPTISHGIAYPNHELSVWNYKKEYTFADDGSLSDRVDILIGNDYYYSLMSTEKVKIMEDLYLVNSEFGWILSGKLKNRSSDDLSVLTYFQSSCEAKLNKPDPPLDQGSLSVLWDLESIGITDSPKINRDEEAVKHFNENTIFKDNRYYVSWPWIEYPPNLPTNFGLAYGRLVNLMKRVDSKTLLAYKETLEYQLKEGIIERVPDDDGTVDHPIHYLPHHGVMAPDKALRIVYDASAKVKLNKSLNECLYCGPMMLEDLTGLLIKFRCHAVGVTADVEKAFLQIGLQEKDRDVTRFLWMEDTNKGATEDNLIHFRFTRVPFGIISSPFLLNATIKHHLLKSESEDVRKVASDIYVDNVLTGSNSTKGAVNLYKESKEAFQKISMNLREWSSNSKEFMQHIPDTNEGKAVNTLGLNWDLDKDTLNLKGKSTHNALTKRGILKTVASIYDPCGFTVPIVLPAKLLLQDLWKERAKWDTPLSEETTTKWKTILEKLQLVNAIYIPRKLCDSEDEDCQLHCFTDSSMLAYAAVVYIVQNNHVNFVIGKARLVPIKDHENLKIPRLELLGVLIGSRLIQFVMKSLQVKVTQQTLWTDSQIVIDWYSSNKLLIPFVSRRIAEIRGNKNLTLRYVPSGLNPADAATRPTTSKEEQERWLTGPDFLSQESTTWPLSPIRDISLLAAEDLSNELQMEVDELDKQRLNSDDRNTPDTNDTMTNPTPPVSMEINVNSQVQKLKDLQSQFFPEEVKGKMTHLTRNLGLFIDVDGLLRCDGRLTHSGLSYDAKHPILLPKDSDVTIDLIKEAHIYNHHVGVPHTLNIIRQQYWIPQGRAQVQKVVSKCKQCVKHGGGPYALPDTPALPPERVTLTTAFSYVGVDYFGPMFVREDDGKRKIWICLFTCLVVRAIHLELVNDLTAEECSLAFRRFIASKGVPSLILSDNALQFKLLSEVITGESISERKIRWKFIPQLAPWHGGVYERIVAIVKHCLKRTLQKHLLGVNQLLTIIKEVEAVVNTRPLTYVGANLDYVLKPSDFLSPGKCLSIHLNMDQQPPDVTTTKQQLIEGWKRGEIIMKEYKDMFINQYLLSLRERYTHSPKQSRKRNHDTPHIGDIVQIKGESKNRENWKVGQICELLKGIDGLCRVAKVKVGNAIFTRSIAQLYRLEVDETEPQMNLSKDNFELPKIHESCTTDTSETPRVVLEELTNSQEERYIDETNNGIDFNNKTTETVESTDMTNEVDFTHDSNETDNTMGNNESIQETSAEGKSKRAAATRALQKIKEWTRNLFIQLQ